MKKIVFILIMILVMPLTVSANYIGEFKRTINVSLNCDFCAEDVEKKASFQLFANGEPVEGQKIELSEANEFKGVFADLEVFDENYVEIEYEVKMIEGEEYKSIPKEDITYEKVPLKKWVQVMPEDIEAGHEYVLFTDNWNYEANGYGKFAVLTGDMFLEETNATPEYNIINGKKSYYTLTMEPSEESIWKTEKVLFNDEEYDTFKDYIMFNSYADKKITLAGYNKGDWFHWIFKQSGKEGYYIDYEDAYYTNKVEIIPIEGTIGRFYIASQNISQNGDLSPKHYMGVDHFYNVAAQTVPEYSAQFLAFEYVEDEVESVYNMHIGTVLCEQKILEEPKEENPNTGNGILIFTITALLLSSLMMIRFKKKI